MRAFLDGPAVVVTPPSVRRPRPCQCSGCGAEEVVTPYSPHYLTCPEPLGRAGVRLARCGTWQPLEET